MCAWSLESRARKTRRYGDNEDTVLELLHEGHGGSRFAIVTLQWRWQVSMKNGRKGLF